MSRAPAVVVAVVAILLGLLPGTARAESAAGATSGLLPVVFVHGNSGSAAQFESQFQRFASNGYPESLLFAYEYDTSASGNTAAIADLDPFIDQVLARTGAPQVLLVAHSRGTTVSHAYLTVPAHAAKVAKYVNLDGRSSTSPPGGVPTLALWGEWNSPPNPVRGVTGYIGGAVANVYNRDESHVQVASSARTFAAIYEFFLGRPPATTDVLPEPPGQVTIAGRAVYFPQNIGFAGALLQLWRVDAATGQRISAVPDAVFTLGDDGAFGPVKVNGLKTYEFALTRPGGVVHHFYQSPYSRSDYFVRLNSSATGQGVEGLLPTSSAQTNLVITRSREMWGDQGTDSDSLTVDTLGDGVPPLDVLTPATAPRSGIYTTPPTATGAVGEVNALFLADVGECAELGCGAPDGITDLSKGDLPPFNRLTFLNAADVFIPAAADGARTVRLVMTARGGGVPEIVNVPDLPSTTDRITVAFRDSVQQSYGFTGKPTR